MWIVASLQGSPKGDMTFTDHHAIDIYTDEESAREAVKSGLRSGDPLVGLFKLEGVYDADVNVQKVR